ncbi:MAG: prepilin-type N-terminal cleavage/methylation domain-containing protein, partial [Candidatus Sumerlaeia bacterium]|nr:prepilin-type N-terminal cleavage/methylation domain-containing protein [Candidatus Sumerlaeia bacterium]
AERAFTLIELLIVVAIIAILASIAVPNFLEAQTRAKVAATQADMRTLATALETYRVDNNRYPFRTPSLDVDTTVFPVFPDGTVRFRDLTAVTSPVAYLSTPPKDIFEKSQFDGSGNIPNWDPINNIIEYFSPLLAHELTPRGATTPFKDDTPWILASVGPDGRLGSVNKPNKVINFGRNSAEQNSWRDEYDPTNGTISFGNIYRLQTQEATINFLAQ